jgi:tRNA pseudouridine38-40 synthase
MVAEPTIYLLQGNRFAEDLVVDVKNVGVFTGILDCMQYIQSSLLDQELFVDVSNPKTDDISLQNNKYLIRLKRKDDIIEKMIIHSLKEELRRVKMEISYDGSDFFGFQKQSSHRSIQGVLETEISLINGYFTSISGSSRTDVGVHALHQVIHFETVQTMDEDRWKVVLNHSLPADLYVKEVSFVTNDFHARYSVSKKTYRYVLYTGEYQPIRHKYAWFVEHLDVELLEKVLSVFVGTHDFTSFATKGKENKIRTIYEVTVQKDHSSIYVDITGSGFLHHMVRLMIGTAVRVTQGELPYSMEELLSMKSRKYTNIIAPSAGLYLKNVIY